MGRVQDRIRHAVQRHFSRRLTEREGHAKAHRVQRGASTAQIGFGAGVFQRRQSYRDQYDCRPPKDGCASGCRQALSWANADMGEKAQASDATVTNLVVTTLQHI